MHPKDPNTAWFVPAISDQQRYPVNGQVVVWRTRDGGKTFDVLRKGLPQEHAYDLTYRHGLDIDETGERLVFGTTTGSLFVSEDTGDSWQTVSTNLSTAHASPSEGNRQYEGLAPSVSAADPPSLGNPSSRNGPERLPS